MFNVFLVFLACFLATPVVAKGYHLLIGHKQKKLEARKNALLVEFKNNYKDMLKRNNLDEIKQAINKEVFFKAYVLITEIVTTDYKQLSATLQRINFKNPEKDMQYALIRDSGLFQYNPRSIGYPKHDDLINRISFENDEKTKLFWEAFFSHIVEVIMAEQKKEADEQKRLAEIERQKIEASYF